MKRNESGPAFKWLMVSFSVAMVALTVGCAERRVVYVPVHQAPPGMMATNAPAGPVVVDQAPPSAQVEVIPATPGPAYYWVPGYWGWQGGGWVWIRGAWVLPPWHGAVWVHGGWYRHRGHWVYRAGRWGQA